jgi:hypothetical protein
VKGERLMARVHAHSRSMGPKMDSLCLHYFGLPPTQPLRLALVDSTDRYLRAWKPVPSCLQFDQQRVLSRFFSLLPTAAFSTIIAKRKVIFGAEMCTGTRYPPLRDPLGFLSTPNTESLKLTGAYTSSAAASSGTFLLALLLTL